MADINDFNRISQYIEKEEATSNFHEQYPNIVSEVMEYIITKKKNSPTAALLDLIQDYCFKKQLPVELVGDAISSDTYFKAFIQSDCEYHNIIRSNKKDLDEW